MKITRLAVLATMLAAIGVLANCGDAGPLAPQAPNATVQAGLIGSLGNTIAKTGLLTCSALPSASKSQTVGPSGGTITVGPHTLTIPAGALNRNVTIKAVIKAEQVNRVHFEPDGLQFAKPATLTMSYANCGVLSILPKRIVYVTPGLSVITRLLSLDDILNRKVSTKIEHFSDYAVEEFLSFSDHAVYW